MYAATRGSTAKRWTVRIRLARATVSALRARASVKRAGKEPTAVKWTKRHCNAYRTAAAMGISISRPRLASANRCGPVMIVQKVRGLINIIPCDRKCLYKEFNEERFVGYFVRLFQ